MTPQQADAALFGDSLACDERRPAAFMPGTLEPETVQTACQRAEALLQAVALVEDSRPGDDAEDRSPTALALQRVEARLDLLTTLVGRLLQRDGGDAVRALRWSSVGARLVAMDDGAAPGSTGWLRLQPCDWLPEALQLPVRVLACEGERLWLHFEPLGPALTPALERHLFRLHRREIAERRRQG